MSQPTSAGNVAQLGPSFILDVPYQAEKTPAPLPHYLLESPPKLCYRLYLYLYFMQNLIVDYNYLFFRVDELLLHIHKAKSNSAPFGVVPGGKC